MDKYRYKEPEEYTIIEWTGDNYQEICSTANACLVRGGNEEDLFYSGPGLRSRSSGIIPKNWFIVLDNDYDVVDVIEDLNDFQLVLNGH